MTNPKPTRSLRTRFTLERLVLIVAIVEPLSTIPQIIQTYTSRDASGLSLLSWALFMTGSVVWLAYGIKLRDAPLIVSGVLWVTTELILVIGIILYS